MSMIELTNSGISSNYSCNLKEKFSMRWIENQTPSLYRILFSTIAQYLKLNQSKANHKSVFTLKDAKGNFKLGAIMTYHKPEEDAEDDKGNWTLEFTLDPDDVVEADFACDNHRDDFFAIASTEAYTTINARFLDSQICNNMYCEAVDVLVQWLDTNAKEDETIELVHPGVFTAVVAVENGTKVMSIVPGEIIKQMIKSDSIL